MPIFLRTVLNSSSDNVVISVPSTIICPDVGRCKPISNRSNVLLPLPLPPNITNVSPSLIVRLTESKITRDS